MSSVIEVDCPDVFASMAHQRDAVEAVLFCASAFACTGWWAVYSPAKGAVCLRQARVSVSNRQYLWIKIFYAASSVAVVSSGRSTSLPFSNFAPARTSATRWGALTARQRDWAASISL